MVELLFLLLPLAFYSGWRVAQKSFNKNQNKQRQLSGHFVKGVNYLLSEEPDKALEIFLNYPDIDEYTAETYQLLGDMFRNRGEVDRALRVHQNLIARANLSIEQKQKAMYSLGQNFYSAGMLDRAESVFQELLSNTKSTKSVSRQSICSSLRIIYEQSQEWQKAIEATACYESLSKKIATDDNKLNLNALTAHYYCELADLALSKGKLHEVEKFMSKAKAIYKKSTRLKCLQGDIYYHQKQYKEALKHYLAAVKHDSRLLNLLSSKIEFCATETNSIDDLQKVLIKLYKKTKDRAIFEVILAYSKRYATLPLIDTLVESELLNTRLNIESIYNATNYIKLDQSKIEGDDGLALINASLANYLQGIPAFRCEHCGYKMHDFLWRCPACHHWDTINHA